MNGVKMERRGKRCRGVASLSCAPGDKDARLLNQHNALSVLDGGDILKHCKACKTEVNSFANAAAQIELSEFIAVVNIRQDYEQPHRSAMASLGYYYAYTMTTTA